MAIGKTKKSCPICGSDSGFSDFNGRGDARCRKCGCLERHRAQWSVFKEHVKPFLPDAPAILHTGPWPAIRLRLESIAGSYKAIRDVDGPGIIKADLNSVLPFDDNTFDLVWSSHVLEHVQDVDNAIAELFRVMKPGGMAILDVPCTKPSAKGDKYVKKTVQFDEASKNGHWWSPGRDWPDRYEKAGFTILRRFRPTDFPVSIARPHVLDLCLCKKPD